MKDIGKWQIIRLIDVLFLGPFMIWLAAKLESLSEIDSWIPVTLIFFGCTTIMINLYFFLKNTRAS